MVLDRQMGGFAGVGESEAIAHVPEYSDRHSRRFAADGSMALSGGLVSIALPGAAAAAHYDGPTLRRVVFEAEPILIGPGQRPRPTRTASLESVQEVVKRAFDVTVAALALIALSPILLAVAGLIKLTSPGPVLFTQQRYGLGNRPFKIFKFRTMHIAAGDPTGVRQTKVNDPRITWLGRILRRTNVDELPQLMNVVLGEMSLVGPRPHVPGMLAAGTLYERLVPHYLERHAVRPGLTGLAQVCGFRGPTDDPEAARARVDHDLTYIAERSLLLDLRILWMTVQTECLGGRGI